MKVTVMRRWRIKPQGSEGVYPVRKIRRGCHGVEYISFFQRGRGFNSRAEFSNGIYSGEDE